MSVRIKICGITSLADALEAVESGADALGLNFWPLSKRRCDMDVARRIAEEIGDRARLVGVYVDALLEEIEEVRAETGVRWAQLHGSEPPELVRALLPEAYKAIKTRAPEMPGDELLIDAAAGVGGTGERADWVLAAELARTTKLWLAGGLTPSNVAEAIEAVRPYGVDVASGVERAPGIKDLAAIRAFVDAARRA